jgi:hypothetical protein
MRKRRSVRRLFKRTAIVLTACWASGLIVFFIDPNKSSEQLDLFYDWLAARKPKPVEPRHPFICREYQTHAWQMVDSVEQYWAHSYAHGIEPLKRERDVLTAVGSGKLISVLPTDSYILDTMHYSFPFVLPETKAFIDTIAIRFQGKLINTELAGTRLIVTSLLRTENSVERLLRNNRNAIRNSAHLHGTTFDLSYAHYDFERPLSLEESEYLKEILALTLFELRREKKCWVTYELFQTCFHVVKR